MIKSVQCTQTVSLQPPCYRRGLSRWQLLVFGGWQDGLPKSVILMHMMEERSREKLNLQQSQLTA